MSGFAGFVQPAATGMDRAALDAMVEPLVARGPDATGIWTGDRAALAHTLFRTTNESASERQPIAAQDRFQFVGDVRLDARADLIARLNHAGGRVTMALPDAEIAFSAWLVWRDACVDHLRGDFSFAVWDRLERRLFAARDPLGVRPFYYASDAGVFVFANHLAAIRRHPAVSDELDDAAIVDLLVFRYFQDRASTAFASVRRLPPGHTVVWQGGQIALRPYWSGPADRPVRYTRRAEYIEHYRDVFTSAVTDRLRTDHVTVAMTGGLDSSSIAAIARAHQPQRGHGHGAPGLEARTIVYDRLIPDRERYFATLAALATGIPLTCIAADDRAIYERHADPGLQPPEPISDPFRAMLTDFYRDIASRGRVLLMGLDGDTLLSEVASDYLLARLRRGEVGQYLGGVFGYIRTQHALPPHRLRTTARQVFGQVRANSDALPAWIDRAMARRFDLEDRWASRPAIRQGLVRGWPLRPRAASAMASPKWAAMFDRHDAEYLGAPLDVRFPFADLRVVEYLLNIPAVPWCIDKFIVRQAMAGILPPEVLARPKAPMAGDTVAARIAQGDRLPWRSDFRPHPRLRRYVNVSALAGCLARAGSAIELDARALSLNEWLWYHLPRS